MRTTSGKGDDYALASVGTRGEHGPFKHVVIVEYCANLFAQLLSIRVPVLSHSMPNGNCQYFFFGAGYRQGAADFGWKFRQSTTLRFISAIEVFLASPVDQMAGPGGSQTLL